MESRPLKEIQRAHDLLLPIATGEIACPFGDPKIGPAKAAMDRLGASLSVLCWVLQHNHNDSFQNSIVTIEDWLKSQGLELQDQGN